MRAPALRPLTARAPTRGGRPPRRPHPAAAASDTPPPPPPDEGATNNDTIPTLPDPPRPWDSLVPTLDQMSEPDWPSHVRDWTVFWTVVREWKHFVDGVDKGPANRRERDAPALRARATLDDALRLAPPSIGAGREWWGDPLYEHAERVEDALLAVLGELGELAEAGVPLPADLRSVFGAAVEAYDWVPVADAASAGPMTQAYVYTNEDGEEESVLVDVQPPQKRRSRRNSDASVPKFRKWVPSPAYAMEWNDVELRAWAEKRKWHVRTDEEFAKAQEKVGAFHHANVDELTDARMARKSFGGALGRDITFRTRLSHAEIMDVVTNEGRNVHPDRVPVDTVPPSKNVDYWEEGVHYHRGMEHVAAVAGRLADEGAFPRYDDVGDADAETDTDDDDGASGVAAALAPVGAGASATLAEPFADMDDEEDGGDELGLVLD